MFLTVDVNFLVPYNRELYIFSSFSVNPFPIYFLLKATHGRNPSTKLLCLRKTDTSSSVKLQKT